MSERSVSHHTFVIERSYPKPPEAVFRAFSDPAKKRRWFLLGDGFEVGETTMDFRVGGKDSSSFRANVAPVEGLVFRNDTIYQDIVQDQRIVFAYTMATGDHRISASLATFEFLKSVEGTTLVFTEQAAFFENADGPEMRKQGWTELLNQLAHELETN